MGDAKGKPCRRRITHRISSMLKTPTLAMRQQIEASIDAFFDEWFELIEKRRKTMATLIPGASASILELIIQLATQGIGAILAAFNKNGAAAAVAAADQVALAVLQQTATIKGLTIDWTNPAAVQAYIATLPTFVPIPAPATPPTAS
jgi:hypothetical protein